MGFIPKRKIYTLDFAGTDHDGLEVRVRGLTTGELLDTMEKSQEASADTDGAAFRELLDLMADRIVSWNVSEEDGSPVPPGIDALMAQDPDFNLAIVNAWTTAISGVPAPLDGDSPSGDPSLVASIPMEPLSPSPESSAVPA